LSRSPNAWARRSSKALLGKECVADDSPYCIGGIGVVGTRSSVNALKHCDGLMIVGSCFPYIEFLPKPGQAKCVQIDHKPEHIALRYPADIGLVGDAQATLGALLSRLARNDDRSFLQQGAVRYGGLACADGRAGRLRPQSDAPARRHQAPF
jgi:pyruvate dehydrogenase (quinone)/pyruvate oxidase